MEPINLLGLTIYPYGLAVAAAAAVALVWSGFRCKKAGLKNGTLSWFALLAVPMAFALARLGYVLCEFEYYLSDDFAFFWNGLCEFTGGGYMLVGALAGGVLAALIACRVTKQPFGRLADALSAPAALTVALCSLAEGLSGTGYGWGLEDWFAEGEGYSVFTLESPEFFCRFPFAVVDYYDEWKWAVFVLMALLFAVTCVMVARAEIRRDGGRLVLFLMLTGALLILGESLRQDSVIKWGFVRVSQLAGAILSAAMLLLNQWKSRARLPLFLRSLAGTVVCILLIIAMEFALEGKISMIEWMPMDACYLVTTLSCVGLVLFNLPLWRRAWGRMAE